MFADTRSESVRPESDSSLLPELIDDHEQLGGSDGSGCDLHARLLKVLCSSLMQTPVDGDIHL